MMMRNNQNYFKKSIGIATCLLICAFVSFSQEETFFPAPILTKDKELKSYISKHYVACTENIDRAYDGFEESHLREKFSKRKESLYDLISEGKLIYKGELYEYVQGVANKIFPESRKVYLIRNEAPEAYNIGDDNLFVHLGLLQRLSNEDELAFVLGHLIAHNELDHFEERMLAYKNVYESDELRVLGERVELKEYCQVAAITRLMVPWVLTKDAITESQETAADIFAIDKLKNADYDPTMVGRVFDILDYNEANLVSETFDINRILGLKSMRSNFSTSLNFTASPSATVQISGAEMEKMRVHAYGTDRKNAFLKEHGESSEPLADESYLVYQVFARKEVIINAIETDQIEVAIYNLLLLHDEDSTDLFTRKLIPFCFAYLGLQKTREQITLPEGAESLKSNENYNRTIYFLESLTPDQCVEITEYWNSRVDRKLEKYLKNADEAILSLIKDDKQTFDLQLMRENDPRYEYLTDVLDRLGKYK
jgi:hypothetical protein